MKPQTLPLASMLFLLGYGLGYVLNLPLFYYLPVSGEIHFGEPPAEAGPAMAWYGLLALGAATALPAPLLAAAGARLPWPRWFWMLPVALMVYVLLHERRWFLL